ncbi:hypothetical protein ACFOVU_12485, partial [Nocardiopsis sediminis]
MPKKAEGDIELGHDGLENKPADRDLEGAPLPTELHDIINIFADREMESSVPPMISIDAMMKADWFESFKSDQKSPGGLTHWLESHLAPTEATWVPHPSGGGSFVGGSDEKTYYSGITYANSNVETGAVGKAFFDHMINILNGPWRGDDSKTFSPRRMAGLAETLDDLVAMVNGAGDRVGEWRATADDALEGATADVFREHLRNIQTRFYTLSDQVGPYPEAIRNVRDTVVWTAAPALTGLNNEWAGNGLADPSDVVTHWFEQNKDIARLEHGDETTQIGDVGKANDVNTWKEIQERVKQIWRDGLNDFVAGANETMRTVSDSYISNRHKFEEIVEPIPRPLDWSGVGGGGGGFGPDDDDESEDNDKSDTQKEYEELLEDYYENEIENLKDLMNDDDGDGEGDENDDDGGPSDSQKEYEEALDKYYQDLLKDLESGPESSEDDLTEDGGGGNNDGPDMEDEYNNALDDYYQNAINDLNSGPEGGGGDLDEDGGGNGGDGPASEDRFNRTLDDYYNRQSDDLESEMNSGPPPPVGGGGSLGGGGGGNNGNRRSSEDRYNRQLDEYYDQAARDLDRELDSGPNG